jgi:membrane-anchored glycerophosphoryl diester phosphodiesterase (GDPDase)
MMSLQLDIIAMKISHKESKNRHKVANTVSIFTISLVAAVCMLIIFMEIYYLNQYTKTGAETQQVLDEYLTGVFIL